MAVSDDTIRWMLDELKSRRLEVGKFPSRSGYIRLVVSQNCEWYRELCSRYMGTRRRLPRPRTIIKRRDAKRALARILAGDRSGVYAERILEVAEWLVRQ